MSVRIHRIHVRAKELKAAGMDRTDVLAVEDENPRARLAAELLASTACGSTRERVKAFIDRGGGCRATFFNHIRKLRGVEGQLASTPKRKAAASRGDEEEALSEVRDTETVMNGKRTIFTIGYGGKTREQFLAPLKRHGVEVVADVRMYPNRASMGMYVKAKTSDKGIEKTLGDARIGYEWFGELGNPDTKDPEMKAFRGLITREAAERTRRLTELGSRRTVCLLCSEKDHANCHRSHIGDYLASQGWEVIPL